MQQQQQQHWAERHIYGSLIRETPASVLEHCRLTVPVRLRDAVAWGTESGSKVTYQSTRATVVESLSRMGSDCVDDVQIQFPSNRKHNVMGDDDSFCDYYLDLLDALQELQRDGLVRSVSAQHMPKTFLYRAQSVGLGRLLQTNQIETNLLNPGTAAAAVARENTPPLLGLPDETPLTIAADPLAGGWLTDRFWNAGDSAARSLVSYPQLSMTERTCWDRDVVQSWWARCRGQQRQRHAPDVGARDYDFRALLDAYRERMLAPLQEVARKHGVSVATVVLRWTLQQQQQQQQCPPDATTTTMIAGAVVPCRLLPERHFWDTLRRSAECGRTNPGAAMRVSVRVGRGGHGATARALGPACGRR